MKCASPGGASRIPRSNSLLQQALSRIGRSFHRAGRRRYLVRRFPYIVHFVIEQDSRHSDEELIVIYAIRHSRRDQNYWLHRLPPEPSGNI